MAEPFIAEVKIFAGTFAPRGYAFCNGQLLQISQNTALFSLVGTTYGGDGRTVFGLPDLQGRAPLHPGNGPGLTPRQLGQGGGSEVSTITEAQMPSHTHQLGASQIQGNTDAPEARVWGSGQQVFGAPSNLQPMHGDMTRTTGGSQAHNNMHPYLGLTFIIALVGLYPSRS